MYISFNLPRCRVSVFPVHALSNYFVNPRSMRQVKEISAGLMNVNIIITDTPILTYINPTFTAKKVSESLVPPSSKLLSLSVICVMGNSSLRSFQMLFKRGRPT